MSLKALMNSDLDLFLNTDEFAETATFGTATIKVLFDKEPNDNFLIDVITCKESDVAGITTSSTFIINSVTYTASSWIAEGGMMRIILNVQD